MRPATRLLCVLGLALLAGMGSVGAALACPNQAAVSGYVEHVSTFVEHDDVAGRLTESGSARVPSVFASRDVSHSHGSDHHHHHDGGGGPHEHGLCHAHLGCGASVLASCEHRFAYPDTRQNFRRAADDAVFVIQLSFLILRPPSLAA